MLTIIVWSLDIWNSHTLGVAFFGYVLPFLINGFEFSLRTIKEYRQDLASRAKALESKATYEEWKNTDTHGSVYRGEQHFYVPKLTVGHILARLIGTVTPIVSFITMLANMDSVFECIGNCFRWLGKLFNIPLVPKR